MLIVEYKKPHAPVIYRDYITNPLGYKAAYIRAGLRVAQGYERVKICHPNKEVIYVY